MAIIVWNLRNLRVRRLSYCVEYEFLLGVELYGPDGVVMEWRRRHIWVGSTSDGWK